MNLFQLKFNFNYQINCKLCITSIANPGTLEISRNTLLDEFPLCCKITYKECEHMRNVQFYLRLN